MSWPGWATVGALAARGERAVAYCANPSCHRFRDFAGVALDLPALPPDATIEQLARALACSDCGRRAAEIVTTAPRWIGRQELAEVFGFARAPSASAGDRAAGAAGAAVEPAITDPADHPLVKAALAAFPGAEIVAIRPRNRADFGAPNAVREDAPIFFDQGSLGVESTTREPATRGDIA